MLARIRFGNEINIAQTIADRGSQFGPDFDALRPYGATVLSFSASVGGIPDLPTFGAVTRNLGVKTNMLPSLERNDRPVHLEGRPAAIFGARAIFVPPSIKTIEVVNPEELDMDRLMALAHGLFALADEHGPENDGILFYDHTVVPAGDIIAVH